jgi:hypothetical protein
MVKDPAVQPALELLSYIINSKLPMHSYHEMLQMILAPRSAVR